MARPVFASAKPRAAMIKRQDGGRITDMRAAWSLSRTPHKGRKTGLAWHLTRRARCRSLSHERPCTRITVPPQSNAFDRPVGALSLPIIAKCCAAPRPQPPRRS
jgi:hypothetical protein